MLRFKDFRCICCGHEWEELVRVGDALPTHCGSTPDVVLMGGPLVAFKPHYSHALGRRVERYSDEDKELAKKGSWIASKSEANSAYGTDIFEDNVTIKKNNDEQIRKHVEKQARKLASDGIIRSGKKGWEYTGPNAPGSTS